MKPRSVRAFIVLDEFYDFDFIDSPTSSTDGMYPIYVTKLKAVAASQHMNKRIIQVEIRPIKPRKKK